MDYSFQIINSIESYERLKFDLIQLDNEYFIWNLTNARSSIPNYESIHRSKFGISIDEKIQKLTLEKESGKPTKETDDINRDYINKNNIIFLLRVNDENIGEMALKVIDKETGLLQSVFIKPDFRGNNYSKILLNKVIEIAKDKELKTLKLDTYPFMKTAINFYLKSGFEYCDYFSGLKFSEEAGKRLQAIYMKKSLE